MRSIVSSKEEWLVGLHELLNVRLRTVSFALAVRVRSNASVPLPLQNTQYLIDGIMWSVRDCVEWAEEAWLCFQSHLQACAKRYTQLCEQLAAVGRTRQCEGLIEKDELERERLYNIHAYLQDIYVAFCIVDAFLRHMNDESRIAKELAEKELPRLVAEHMPIWQRTGSYHVQEAVEDHRLLFLDLLRSWTATKILRADTQRRIEEHVRHRLKTLRDAVLNGNGRGATTLGGGDGVLRNRDEQRYTAISAGLRALMSDVTASSMVPISTSCPSKQSAPGSAVETARLTIASFTYAIFPPPRSEAGRNRCAHCGVILRNPNAKSSHYRYHFCSRNYQTDLKIVRLPYPSMEDYVTHVVDCGETGSFVRVTQDMLEVLRAPDKQIVHVRRNVSDNKAK
ncbi:hypothetical protein ERJ75_000360800 [Trypanosoma vivax]|uniref:C2H2-type domain-containing protein n=1 Tax=Trypanosoma vivax (strain Y486) TaxID=1055687 RepID=G0TUR1_TRYVY|nr:hypothetical protein ERJ75_000360800 [Trypanosoma vivax]CCC47696.1 conserved hypothetical protein [Trypanosoma vivax Y486]